MNRRPQKSRSTYDAFSPRHSTHFRADTPGDDFFVRRRRRSPARTLALSLSLLLALLLLGNLVVNAFVHVRRVSVPVTGLTEAFDGFTLLHISDLKGASFGSAQRGVRSAIRDEDVDVVLLTGDMVSPLGNAQPLYALLEGLAAELPGVPVYFIAGDSDPEATSLAYAGSGSPFAPWVLGAQQRGAILLSSPERIDREAQTLWLSTIGQLNLDLATMTRQYEQRYLSAAEAKDEIAIELAKHNLSALQKTETARDAMDAGDVFIALTHVPPAGDELPGAPGSLTSQLDLVLCGHYLGGLVRLPLLGPLFVPSQSLPLYGLFPGADSHTGLTRTGRTWIYTSPGLGSSDALYPPFFFRLFNPPSVTLITLTPSSL